MGMNVMELATRDLGELIGAANANLRTLPGPVFNVKGYGAKGDGVADDTAAITDALADMPASGGTLYFPDGEYVTGPIPIPAYPKVVNIQGSGIRQTILRPRNANQPLIKAAPALGATGFRALGNHIGGFSIKAHASGSTGEVINARGFSNCLLHNIEYLSNGNADFATVFEFAASTLAGVFYATYENIIDTFICSEQTFTGTLIKFTDDGQGSLSGSNGNKLKNLWIFANYDLSCAIDMNATTDTTVYDSIFEANTAAIAIKMGSFGKVRDCWLERNNTHFSFATGAFTANSNWIYGNYMDESSVNYPAGTQDNVFFLNQGATPVVTGYYKNQVIKAVDLIDLPDFVDAPKIIKTSGAVAGTLTALSAEIVKRTPKEITYLLGYSWTPVGGGNCGFQVDSKAGYKICGIDIGIFDGNTGECLRTAALVTKGDFWLSGAIAAAVYNVAVFVTYSPTTV